MISPTTPNATAIISTFDAGSEGWTVVGDPSSQGWAATGGDPGGYLQWVDGGQGVNSYYQAPSEFDGDKSAFYGGLLSYEIKETGSDLTGYPDVELTGDGMTLVATVGQAGTDWTHLSIKLSDKGGWHVGGLGGDLATADQIKAVLGALETVQIRAEYVNGGESGGLDDVAMTAAGAKAQTWNLYDTPAQGTVDGDYASFSIALANASAGNEISDADLAKATEKLGTTVIHINQLTVAGDARMTGEFDLGKGVSVFSLAGATDASIVAGKAAALLTGSDGDNAITGGVGDDTLIGGSGSDTLTGGKGADTFAFTLATDSHKGAVDLITDLTGKDHIDLHAFGIGASDVTAKYNSTTDVTTFSVDTNHDGKADLIFAASGEHTVAGTDFIF